MSRDALPKIDDMTYGELLEALRKDLQIDASTDVLPGTILASLIDRNGSSKFLQLLSAQKLQLTSGVSGTSAGGAGWNTFSFATATGFTSFAYFYSVIPATSLTVVSHAINASNTTGAQLAIDVNLNAPTNVHFYWAAIGK